jgi:hypothetical protein
MLNRDNRGGALRARFVTPTLSLSIMLSLASCQGQQQETDAPFFDQHEQRGAMREKLDVELEACELTDGETVVRVTNNNDFLVGVFVEVGIYDAEGVKVEDANANVTVPAGRTARHTMHNQGLFGEGTCEVDSANPHRK